MAIDTSTLNTNTEFPKRHIGPRDHEIAHMLKTLGFSNLEEMTSKTVPKNIRTQKPFPVVGNGVSEFEVLKQLKQMLSPNKIAKSYIGLGYHDTITPGVILRNVFENPAWYTAYTPYQAEIAQGRLEALLNFQTMVAELTGMEISNSSLLDEGTAVAEAMAMAQNLSKIKDADTILVSPDLHPQSIEVLQTRAEPLGIKVIKHDPLTFDFSTKVFAAFLQYPNTTGEIKDYKAFTDLAHTHQCFVVASTDLLSLTLLRPPGEWGADIVVGNTQRFGVPMGFGGPHAAFLATKNEYKRLMPGRLIGVSVDSSGKPALRLALQTREQHIRREKATSNICTAQVLLANMASFYAVYHGPKGLKAIATRVHNLALILSEGLKAQGHKVLSSQFFDTLCVEPTTMSSVLNQAKTAGINFRILNDKALTISLDEATTAEDIEQIWNVFANGNSTLNFTETAKKASENLQGSMLRTSEFLTHPVFNSHHSESEMLRYIFSLQNKDLSLTHSMIPLGSCTMKLNATTELLPVSWPEISRVHPFAPIEQTQGYLHMIKDLEAKLADVTGFAAVSLAPNAGSQGEYAGLLVIRKYFQSKGQSHRDICLIPSSAHGTNPASAVMAGMKVVVVNCDTDGNVDVEDLKAKVTQYKDNLACLMVTYPSTHGVFEAAITDICKMIHDHGGQVYMDGANMNALVGLCRPGEFGADVSHMNLHKTFSIPHGGGGPGVGPIGVGAHLAEFLPRHATVPESGPKNGVGAVTSAPWGSASILPISWTYITMMGAEGLKTATQVAILSANYIAKKLEKHYPVLYKGKEGMVAHECIIDLRPLKKTSGIDVSDVAKRLMDYGFHAPTMSFPVAGTLMIEPTESEPLSEIERFIEAMIQIRTEIQMVEDKKLAADDNPLINSPHTMNSVTATEWKHSYSREMAAYPLEWLKTNKFWPAVGRVDNAYGDRNLVCACLPIDQYK
jgi:glycine dehydrogenase